MEETNAHMMSTALHWAILTNDVVTFRRLLEEDPESLDGKTKDVKNTALHVASTGEFIELVEELLTLRPEMAAAKNANGETPMDMACSLGNVEVVKRLTESNQWMACEVDNKDPSPVYKACFNGHIEVVKLLLKHRWMWSEEVDGRLTPLHGAVSRVHSGS